MTGPDLPVSFRPRRTRAVLVTLGAVMCAAVVANGLVLDLGPGERASFIITGLLFLGGSLLLSRPKVTADEAGVTVTNLTTVRRLEWPEIVRVNLRQGDPWVHLDLADGTSMPAMGIQPGIAKQQAIADATQLRALVERHGSASHSG
ncbi:PH domain-containing protein [Streptomyces sp. A7024]|uniref:PH domain-containing protein n=1 Tax=Streptomyces coryli TaxID=1128680 RepID=A0A6G4U1N2_9ACTN|nr:PH domain-containing protein [Streptomyces coryli]